MNTALHAGVRSIAIALLVAGCAVDSPANDPALAPTAPSPKVGLAGSTDSADRDCNVVLRDLARTDPQGSGNYNTNAAGDSWVFTGTITISSAAAAQSLVPTIMWTTGDASASDAVWYTATGTPYVDPSSGSASTTQFTVTIDHDAPGPTAVATMSVADYVTIPGGGRLFDHNVNTGDFDNYVVDGPDFAIWPAQGTCQAPTSTSTATLQFNADFTQQRLGVIYPGGTLAVSYDSSRLSQCAASQMQGLDQWAITAFLQFDSGELLTANVLDGPATFTVPTDGAHNVAVWFEATSRYGCNAYDSNLGANYAFPVATPPQWIGEPIDLLTRGGDSECAGGTDATDGFSFDTWARSDAGITNLCFEAYQPGVTDFNNPNLWQQLDSELHWRLVGSTNVPTAWQTTPVDFYAYDGNNAQYAFDWRTIDPFRDFHCPEVAPIAITEGESPYVQINVEYFVSVNGGELHPQEDGNESEAPSYAGSFVDYPTNSWRTANCPAQ